MRIERDIKESNSFDSFVFSLMIALIFFALVMTNRPTPSDTDRPASELQSLRLVN